MVARNIKFIQLVLVLSIGFANHALAAQESGICGNEPEKWICSLTGDSETQPFVDKERAFRALKNNLVLRAYHRANKTCKIKPMLDVEGDELAQYQAAFEDTASTSLRMCVAKEMQTVALEALAVRFPTFSITKAESFVETMKDTLVGIVNSDNAFDEPQKAEIAREIRSTVVVTTANYDKYASLRGAISNPFAFGCGSEARPTAFLNYGYSKFRQVTLPNGKSDTMAIEAAPTNLIIACPGLFMELLNSSDQDPYENWYRIMGHELSHNFHAFLNKRSYIDKALATDSNGGLPAGWMLAPSQSYWPAYSNFVSCYKDHFSPAPNRTDPRDLLKPSVPDSDWAAKYKVLIGRPADQVESYMTEASAEYWGLRAMAALVAKKPATERVRAARNAMKLLCPTPGNMGLITQDVVGTHPNQAFRLRNALRNPELRQALGCVSNEAPFGQPWCTL